MCSLLSSPRRPTSTRFRELLATAMAVRIFLVIAVMVLTLGTHVTASSAADDWGLRQSPAPNQAASKCEPTFIGLHGLNEGPELSWIIGNKASFFSTRQCGFDLVPVVVRYGKRGLVVGHGASPLRSAGLRGRRGATMCSRSCERPAGAEPAQFLRSGLTVARYPRAPGPGARRTAQGRRLSKIKHSRRALIDIQAKHGEQQAHLAPPTPASWLESMLYMITVTSELS